MNALSCNSDKATRQVALQDPMRAAQLHNFALRVDLRKVRRDLVGSPQVAAVNRLLDVNAAVTRSLEWLNGKAEAVPDDFEALDQLAIESGVVPDAVEVVAQ